MSADDGAEGGETVTPRLDLPRAVASELLNEILADGYSNDAGIDVQAIARRLGFNDRHDLPFGVAFSAARKLLRREQHLCLRPIKSAHEPDESGQFPGIYLLVDDGHRLADIDRARGNARKRQDDVNDVIRAHEQAATNERVRVGIARRKKLESRTASVVDQLLARTNGEIKT